MNKALKNVKYWSIFFWTLLMQLIITKAGNVVPVMLWSDTSSRNLINPLHKTSRPEFERILAERIGKSQPPIIVFVKDNFCVEDIKFHKQNLQQLNNAGTLTYLTAVESALSVFENLSSYNISMKDNIESVFENQLALIQVNNLNTISEIYNSIRESSLNLVVAVTGKSCSYGSLERVKRTINTTNHKTHFIINTEEILFFAEKNPMIKFNMDDYVQLESPTFTSSQRDDKHYNLTMIFKGVDPNGPYKISLKAQFNITNGYFRFLGFQYQPDGNNIKYFLKSTSDIYFPFNFSYHCSNENIFSYKNNEIKQEISLKIINLQVQMDTNKFGDVYDCVGFMSIPIWTGIFVTSILTIIMVWALIMIMDIRTMDRFDDPKGKTITISAQD